MEEMKKVQRETVKVIGLDSRDGLSLLLLMQQLIIVQVTALEPGSLQNKEKQQCFRNIYNNGVIPFSM